MVVDQIGRMVGDITFVSLRPRAQKEHIPQSYVVPYKKVGKLARFRHKHNTSTAYDTNVRVTI